MLAVLIVLALLVAWYVVATYNRFVKLRLAVEESWRNVDVELSRRYDLIPNLVAVVKGAAAFESSTYEAVTQARQTAMNATTSAPHERVAPETALTDALSRLLALAEAYPQLTATQNFRDLQDELANTEDRIAAGRRFYNQNVGDYNTKLRTVPSGIVGSAFKFVPADFFAADEAAGGPVNVGFNTP